MNSSLSGKVDIFFFSFQDLTAASKLGSGKNLNRPYINEKLSESHGKQPKRMLEIVAIFTVTGNSIEWLKMQNFTNL
jgi:hypothetical protein